MTETKFHVDKVTLIAAGFLEDRFWKDGVTDRFYSSGEEFAAEVAATTGPRSRR